MAEESEKKQTFVVHKKQADNTPRTVAASNANNAGVAKKKVVVVKKRLQDRKILRQSLRTPKKTA